MELKNRTSYKIGGPAKRFHIIKSLKDLMAIDLNGYILGAGTNILVSDRGVDKVIKIELNDFKLTGTRLVVGAGFLLKKAGLITAKKGLKGLVHVSGIPGTIGGAIIMNAGASLGTISDYLISVKALNRKTKKVKLFTKEECGFGHRTSAFHDWIVLSAIFQMKPAKNLIELYNRIQEKRKRDYPSFPSAGCWFKGSWGGNDIIRKAKMVGEWEGRAVVSPMFPSFILNTGGATSKEVLTLVKRIQDKTNLELEIVVWK